jgi:serine/threonine protein kinase
VHRIADYSFVRTLGEGNHGEFHLATPPARLRLSTEYVAVKVLNGGGSEESFRRMTKELRAFASVQSPYLVTLYDAGQEGGTFYYSMEYFPLGSLAAPARPLTRPETIRAVTHAARAAHSLHEAGVAHRDIKPANVMLHEHGAKLSDLGLAQVLQPGQTVTGIGTVGSIEFIDPVIMRGERASRATDIWSLGLTLHRALTGVGVYGELPDRDPLLALRKVLSTSPTLDPGLSPAERSVVEACIEPDLAKRIPTAEALAQRLDQLPT